MTWVDINNRVLELERKKELTSEEIVEWNMLVSSKEAGVLKRRKYEENNGEAKEQNSGA